MLNRSLRSVTVLLAAATLALVGGACKKKVAPPPPTPPAAPAAAAPTVSLSASSTFIQKGQAVTLTWSSTNATTLDLEPGVGPVPAEGSRDVTPEESTDYVLTANGPGGTADARVRVTVAPPPAPAPKAAASLEELFASNVYDAFFDFNKSDIRPDARDALAKTAEFLRSYPQIRVTIEGHCDERGSTEYNLGLGERRAQAAKNFLISLGVTADRMETISFGKERPFCLEHNEECWQKNRRAHFVLAK
jgi:peptidoglycan-associated lipoprotein